MLKIPTQKLPNRQEKKYGGYQKTPDFRDLRKVEKTVGIYPNTTVLVGIGLSTVDKFKHVISQNMWVLIHVKHILPWLFMPLSLLLSNHWIYIYFIKPCELYPAINQVYTILYFLLVTYSKWIPRFWKYGGYRKMQIPT